ncbi:MAG: DNA repair protein RecN [Crocinitomicaceae bacterium]|nr:DNA repair protein RecN [Crocinitomicaceae bacterium]
MVSSLRIENFALIETALINFNSGFTVITGETGSGKSILLNALNLILGERANFSVIGNLSDKSIVEAELVIKGFGLESFFEENELDYFDDTIVRREIHKQGRSRAFINDTPVQLNVLKAFTSQLIHIHSQYNTLELKDVDFQLKVLDILADTFDLRTKFNAQLKEYLSAKKQLEKMKSLLSEAVSKADYNAFQLNELEELNLQSCNYEFIQNELNQVENADDIRIGFGLVIDAFYNDDGITDKLNVLKSNISKKAELDPSLIGIHERINALLIESIDIASEAEDNLEKMEVNPDKIDELTSMLDAYNRILQKHNVSAQEDLIKLYDELTESSFQYDKLESDIEVLRIDLEDKKSTLYRLGEKLHNKRLKAIPKIEKSLKDELSELKLENTTLNFDLEAVREFNDFGTSNLTILFSPNLGIEPVPVHQAASGGELSRVMLALQSLMSAKVKLRTMLFDEIDTGVSGDVAQKMGTTLKKMGQEMQVIAITHLPQVAAKGGQHLKVLKKIEGDKTKTFVSDLSDQERVEETARLMSGDEINAAALDNAKALMQ